MLIDSRSPLVERHPRELRTQLWERGDTLDLVILPGELDTQWPRRWIESADSLSVHDERGQVIAVLQARGDAHFDLRKPSAYVRHLRETPTVVFNEHGAVPLRVVNAPAEAEPPRSWWRRAIDAVRSWPLWDDGIHPAERP